MTKVLFGGCFDLFHMGHLLAIQHAKSLGDYLVIQVASDEEIRHKKGKSRPVIPEMERAALLENLRPVDEVMLWPGLHDPKGILNLVRPDVLVVNEGGKYQLEERLAKVMGFKLAYIPRYIPNSNLDTTRIINKIVWTYK